MPDLASSPSPWGFDMPPVGGGSSPGTDSSSGSSVNWGGIASKAAPLILSMFGNNPAKAKAGASADSLSTLAAGFGTSAKGSTDAGNAALAPVLKYLQGIVGGNSADVLGAAAPDRARIMDQYDTARKSISAFSPRGGGTTSTQNDLQVKKASDLATTTATARTAGVNELAQLGMGFEQLGANQETQALQATSDAQKAYQISANEQDKALSGMGSTIGGMLGMMFGGPAGGAVGSFLGSKV